MMGGMHPWKIAILAALGIVLTGGADYLLVTSGRVGLARAVWTLGFGITVLVVWYLWLRPLDLTGPNR